MLKAVLLLLFFVAMVAAIVEFVGYSSCNGPPIEHDKNTETKTSQQEDCSTPYTAFKVGRYIAWNFVHESHEEIIALGTVFIAIFTIILGLFTINLASATDKLVKEAEQTSVRQLRAYVFVDTIRITHIQDGDGIPEALVRKKQFGQTPAYQCIGIGGLAISPFFPPPPDLDLSVTDDKFVDAKTRSVMGPSQTELILFSAYPAFDRPLSEEERLALSNGQLTIYVYGRIKYCDVFGKAQWSSFRYMVGGPVGVRGNIMAGCEEGNDAT